MSKKCKPNLFSIATGELSQDAVITWLLKWADPDCSTYNQVLHEAATAFVTKMLEAVESGTNPVKIEKVEAGRQWENIDIWAEINDSHLIIIEDKTGTDQHSDQLRRYRETAEKWCEENDRNLVCVYIKTHSESQFNRADVERADFKVITRNHLLAILDAYHVESDIYNDFRNYLHLLNEIEFGFAKKPVGDWDDSNWKGFYQTLEEKHNIIKWHYVANPAGGFWNLVLNWHEPDGQPVLYMQIEQGDLCYKIGEVYENRRETRDHYHEMLISASEKDSMGLQRPGRFGCGTYMTVAIVPRHVWLGADSEVVDIEAVTKRLNKYEAWFRKTIGVTANSQP